MKNSTYPTLSGYLSTYHCLKAAALLTLFSVSILSAFSQTAPSPVEIRLQPGETAVRQITVTNPGDASLNFQTALKETTASLARRTIAPTSLNGLNVAFFTGFEDYTLGDLGNQQGWTDWKTEPYENFRLGNTIPVEASISTTAPFSGEKHLTYEWVDTTESYRSYSPQVEPEQTSPVRSVVFHINLTGTKTGYKLFTFERNRSERDLPPNFANEILIEPGGYVRYWEYDAAAPGGVIRKATPYIVDPSAGYIEVTYVVNRITNTFDFYFDGQRLAENVNSRLGVVDGMGVVAENRFNLRTATPPGPSFYLDDLTIADGDASTPNWISTPTATGTLPAQGQRTLEVAVNTQGLAPGTYEAEVQVLDEAFGSITTVPVTLIVEEPPLVVVEDLNLTSMCSDDPNEELRWRIRNPNDFNVATVWQVNGTIQTDTVTAPPGDSFFFTQTEAGANTTTIRWENENGQTRQSTKASGKAPCQPVVAEPSLLAYPTFIENELNLEIDGAGEGRLFIFSERYALVYRAKVAPGTHLVLSADELGLQSGLTYYILLAIPGPNGWKVLKQTVHKR